MFRRILVVLVVMMLVLSPMVSVSAKEKTKTGGLTPGEFRVFEQTIPINLVFLGYESDQVEVSDVLGELPVSSAPVVRYPLFYGLDGRDLGLNFTFQYNPIFTDTAFENKFFNYLKKTGVPGDLTDFQLGYNEQDSNVLDVSDTVLYIDAPSVEAFLLKSAGKLGIDAKHSYTIFFINWFSRPDFQFHVYTKTDEPDPDTGYNFGIERASRQVIAWGGEHGRAWFYDLSAGPEAWTDNWLVDFQDLDGNGVEDYRMPPVWEYTAGGFRAADQLDNDLGLVTRFVAINLLFTSSPLYDPLVTAPHLYGQKILHTEMFQDVPGESGLPFYNNDLSLMYLKSFEPYYDWEANLEDNDPIQPEVQRSLQIFSEVLMENDCWNAFGTPFAQLFCFFDANKFDYSPAYDPEDYIAYTFAFHTTAATLGSQFGLLGFSDDDWVSGTQSYVFVFGAPEYRDLGYGFTTTVVHEIGHHIGLSHPHDGYDPTLGLDYGPADDFYYAWSGDESRTIMQYIALTNEFGQFDRDNMYRYEFAGYMNWSNDLLAQIMADPDASNNSIKAYIKKAQSRARQAEKAFFAWDYLSAVTRAHDAYLFLLKAAELAGIDWQPAQIDRMLLGAPRTIELFPDPIRFPNN